MSTKNPQDTPAAARAELARWQAILGSPEATGRELLAMHLCAHSTTTIDEARKTLSAAGIECDTEAALVQRILAAGRHLRKGANAA